MELSQDHVALLTAGDYEKLSKREQEEYDAMQERIAVYLLQASNAFQAQFPGLEVDWRFQMEVYQSVQIQPATVRYSGRVY